LLCIHVASWVRRMWNDSGLALLKGVWTTSGAKEFRLRADDGLVDVVRVWAADDLEVRVCAILVETDVVSRWQSRAYFKPYSEITSRIESPGFSMASMWVPVPDDRFRRGKVGKVVGGRDSCLCKWLFCIVWFI
jgi:hypothetical protein